MKAKVIAFYLPQFHPTADNNLWWGPGFTEWSNVASAKKLYKHHYQPKIPRDLGFYDLRLPEVRQQQADLAKKSGLAGFCYYHYWFGGGKQELELPFEEVVSSGSPDFPFCLCWANESWHRKFWQDFQCKSKQLLIEQKYPGSEDNRNHFFSLLQAFKDPRYLKYNGKPIFLIYHPLEFPDVQGFMNEWTTLAKANGLNGFHFVGNVQISTEDIDKVLDLGFDAVYVDRMLTLRRHKRTFAEKVERYIRRKVLHHPDIYPYEKGIKWLIGSESKRRNVYPTIFPNWDHTPRSGNQGFVLQGSTPELFSQHINEAIANVSAKEEEDRIIFLKAWNEWGEGNYMEPDMRYGEGYINALKNCL